MPTQQPGFYMIFYAFLPILVSLGIDFLSGQCYTVPEGGEGHGYGADNNKNCDRKRTDYILTRPQLSRKTTYKSGNRCAIREKVGKITGC